MKRIMLSLLIAVVIGAQTSFVQAEVYQWTDENGNIHFGDKPGGENSKKLKYKSQPQQINKPPRKSTEELANELRDSRLKREGTRKKANEQANIQQCNRRKEEIDKLRQEVSRIARTYSRFSHSD